MISTGDGDDWVDAGAGDDTIAGGEGDDWLQGGDGDDDITGGEGIDTLIGGKGDDTFRFVIGHGADTVVGGDDTDEIIIDGIAGQSSSFLIEDMRRRPSGNFHRSSRLRPQTGGRLSWNFYANCLVDRESPAIMGETVPHSRKMIW